VSSDAGGALLLREVERRLGLIGRLAGCFSDLRDQRFVEHSVEELLRQRIGALALAYEDLNDHDRLRLDPALALMAGKKDIEGLDRLGEEDRGKALAAHSTLNRLELGALGGDGKYKKIIARNEEIEALLIAEAVKAIPRRSSEIVLDFDATDDPLHGAQEGAYFNGYYRHYCYLPLYCFCGSIPLYAKLRDCKRDASEGTVEALAKMLPLIRKRFGRKVRVIVRGDSGFCREPIMAFCERHKIYFCLGMARNNRLGEHLEESFQRLHERIAAGELEVPCREFVEFRYRTLESWSRLRRMVGKAEVLAKGENPRFVVTNLPRRGFGNDADRGRFSTRRLYEEFYCARGDMENRIKEQQQDLFADRTSSHWMAPNQLRLWFSAFAHLMLSVLRAEVLRGTALAKATLGQIRLKLFKIAGRIKVSCRRIHIELASACPYREVFARAHHQLARLGMT
jgi:hypothetical protein